MMKKLFILAILALVTTPAFAQSVDTAWVRRYNGPGDSTDFGYAIAVDDSGNIYVTGESYGSGPGSDYATIKYYPNGDTAWVRRYNGPGNSGDEARDIAIDASGNVYVTGESWGSGTNYDYATIKYYPDGDTAWVRRYNYVPINNRDYAYAIAVDGSGNVYVTGYSWDGTGTGPDYATLKYDPAGTQLWVQRYIGPGNSEDDANAIAVDGSGNVYVTGRSVGSGTNFDYATIKYDPQGTQLWVRRYNGLGSSPDEAFAIAVDGSNNVYVTGYSAGSVTDVDYATIKYYPNGDTAWLRRYNGPGNYWDCADYAYAIAVDGSGNVYVTGRSVGIGTYYDYATLKYDPAGDTAWVRRYNGPGNYQDYAYAIAIDGSGNVYVTGYSWGSGTERDYATIKYDPQGTQFWVQRYNGPGNSGDEARDIAIDASGNVYVTGYSVGSGIDFDYATIKYVQFLCGDVNKDGVINSADVVYLINYLFIGGPAPVPILQVGDVNQDGVINSADVVYLINYLFIGGPAPCQ